MSEFFVATPAKKKIAHDQENELYATFSFFPPKMENDERALLDISVAMDRSGSMGTEKMEAAKQSLQKLVDHLKPDDTLGVVVFDSTVDIVFEPMKMTAENKGVAKQKISQIQSRSATNLSGGLFKALDFLKGMEKAEGRVRKCLVFTDGQANNGISDPKQLAEAALEYRAGIGISSFGYGRDHNAELLSEISQDGSFYFIETPDKILHAFGTELGGLVSTFAQNVELRLTPGEGVQIDEVLNDLTVNQDGGQTPGTTPSTAVIVTCDDLLADLEYHVVVRLKTDSRKNLHPRDTTLVTAKAKFVNLVSKQPQEETCALKVRFVKPEEADTEDDKKVMHEVAIQTTANAVAQAAVLANSGQYIQAQNMMLDNAVFCVDVGAQGIGDISKGLSENYSQASYTAGGQSSARGAGRMLRSRRVLGGEVRNIDPSVLKASLGSNVQMNRMVESFTGDSDGNGSGSTGSSSADAVQQSSTVASDPMAPELGSVPSVRTPGKKKQDKEKKKAKRKEERKLSKQRSSRW
jgi:Ca-activated chloride channel family protein